LLPAKPSVETTAVEPWETAAQGWVHAENRAITWRPIVTTSDRLDGWPVDTYLGVVSGESTFDLRDHGGLSGVKREAVEALVMEALARGAHGAIALSLAATEASSGVLVTATATAVTLAYRA
jgi:uncharacterized protein YbjQ (UPF0145 family)